jgi:predicted 3-demethylubiquinone-9 3-methyltransferase (glyoxalase superfamily)
MMLKFQVLRSMKTTLCGMKLKGCLCMSTNKDKRRTARYYERFSRYQTTKRERDFNNYWNKVVERMKEGKNK